MKETGTKTTTKNEMVLNAQAGVWHATYLGPHAARIVSLFGTRTLPTSFRAIAPLADVARVLAALNPGVTVR